MSEVAQGSISFLAIVLTAISAWFWMLGGRSIIELLVWKLDIFGFHSNRIYGRLIAPIFFSLSVIGISLLSDNFRWIYLLFVPLYVVISTSGHSTFLRRLIECWCYSLPGVLIVWNHTELCTFWTLQMLILAPTAAVIGHYFNQKTAPRIEFLVNFLRVAMIGYLVS